MASDNPRRRCAIYTRKSTEEGLDKAFNSLDAQREACAAYVMSQQHEGWTLVPDVYDDGGFSGGTIQRPALQQLLADVRAGRVDVVVVYKIDRLTRSLSDFAKIVDVLDAANASFVSVTQAMVPDPASELRRIYREDLATFAMRAIAEAEPALVLQWNWHHDLIVDRLIALYTGDIRRLLICVPPRSLKSLLCSVVYPAWLLGREAGLQIVCVSYSQPLATTFARKCRTVIESPFYKATFATRIPRDNRSADDFATTGGGCRMATSVEGTLTGRGGDIVILDDPLKGQDAFSQASRHNVFNWYKGTMASRLNSKKDGRVLAVMQRLHEDDLAATLIEEGGWTQIILPATAVVDEVHEYRTLFGPQVKRRKAGEALHPELEPLSVLEYQKKTMGPLLYNAQYQQDPVPFAGNLVKRAWFKVSELAPETQYDAIVISIDPAHSSGIVIGQPPPSSRIRIVER